MPEKRSKYGDSLSFLDHANSALAGCFLTHLVPVRHLQHRIEG
jgi:hypothetical protein